MGVGECGCGFIEWLEYSVLGGGACVTKETGVCLVHLVDHLLIY